MRALAVKTRMSYLAGLFWVIPCLLFWKDPVQAQTIQQPINFLHQTHVALNELTCEFCHVYARRSSISGVPPVKVCAGCHLHLPGTVPAQANEIRKVIEIYWKKGRPIPWKKIHDLPDFIDFSHERHITVGFDCTDCHGDIMETKVPQPFPRDGEVPQSMGWCLTCHQTAHLTAGGEVLGATRPTRGWPESSPAEFTADGTLKGSRDCVTCHQ